MTDERDYTRYRIGKPLAMDGHRIENVGEPVEDDDAATKGHVDALRERVEQLEQIAGKDLAALAARIAKLERGAL